MEEPRYEGNELIRPENYRRWMFVGSNVGLGYSEGQPSNDPKFHHIYIQPEAYRHFAETGKYPDKTMLVMEVLTRGTNTTADSAINKRGQFADRSLGIEVAVKDESRFPEKWAYFNFISGGKVLPRARPFPKEACWNCHNQHGARDNTFVQFYPVLRELLEQRASTGRPN